MSSCRTKCASQWEAFQEGLAASSASAQGATTLSTRVQSLFFPSSNPSMVLPGKLVALTEGAAVCKGLCSGGDDGCLAAAVVVGEQILVSYYCVPLMPSSSVYAAANVTLNWASELGSVAIRVAFADQEGGSLVAIGTVANGTGLFLSSRAAGDAQLFSVVSPFPTTVEDVGALHPVLQLLYLSGMRPVRLVGFVALRDFVLLDVAVRTLADGRYAAGQATVWLSLGNASKAPTVVALPSPDVWHNYAVVEYADSSVGSASLLLWPTASGYVPKRVTVLYGGGQVRVLPPEPFSLGTSLTQRAAITQQSLLLAKGMRVLADGTMAVFGSTGDRYDWLRQLRIEASGLSIASATAANSQPVQSQVTVATRCDGVDCRACGTLQLRALCSSYQSCAIFRCVGTPINQKRPLCGVGLLLRSTGVLGVQMLQGGWTIFVEMFVLLLRLSSERNLNGVSLEWPDDTFFGYVCAAKDSSADFFSILTATINSALQKAQVPVNTLQSFANVDASANAVLSLTTTSVTGFLHQAALFPLFMMVVARQTVMCQANGMLAVVEPLGFSVTISSYELASSTEAIAGQCLTMREVSQAQQTSTSSGDTSLTGIAGTALGARASMSANKYLEPIIHMVDGGLAYVSGLVGSFGNVLQSFDLRHCLLPDTSIAMMAQVSAPPSPPARARAGVAPLSGQLGRTCCCVFVCWPSRLQCVWWL